MALGSLPSRQRGGRSCLFLVFLGFFVQKMSCVTTPPLSVLYSVIHTPTSLFFGPRAPSHQQGRTRPPSNGEITARSLVAS